MTVSNWDETTANGRRRVFRIEIERPDGGETIARFHLERVFVDEAGKTVAKSLAGSWDLPLAEALQDPELAPIAAPVALGLEALSEALYQREQARLKAPAPEDDAAIEAAPDAPAEG